MTVDAQATYAATIVDEFARGGVRHAVVCPGSRSTPLALALLRDTRIQVHVLLDERSAGFFALGLPIGVVVTTSGTAAAELHPAIVEAHHSRLPLIVCTADRPPELHDVGAPQTIRQAAMFGGGVLRWAFEPGVVDGLPEASWRSIASRAVAEATRHPLGPGPVHLNLAFRDPLVSEAGELPRGRSSGRPWHRTVDVPRRAVQLPDDVVDRKQGLIVAGPGQKTALDLGRRLGWPVLADPRSQCRGHGDDEVAVIAAFDSLLRSPVFATRHRPDVVLRLGPPPASKVLSRWLSELGRDIPQVLVDGWGWSDPERTATLVLGTDDVPTVSPDAVAAPRAWADSWRDAEAAAQSAIDDVLAGHADLTEPAVAREITRDVTTEAILFAASSMPIRDVEWFGHPTSRHSVFANRGANGIDGLVSSALGVAAGWGSPVVALLGDLAFLHDAGGLLGAAHRVPPCCFVVVDNDGGGIFSFLPQASELDVVTFESLFGTPHGIDLDAIAATHGIPVERVERISDLALAIDACLLVGGVRMVLVKTERSANVAVHEELHAAVAAAVDAAG